MFEILLTDLNTVLKKYGVQIVKSQTQNPPQTASERLPNVPVQNLPNVPERAGERERVGQSEFIKNGLRNLRELMKNQPH